LTSVHLTELLTNAPGLASEHAAEEKRYSSYGEIDKGREHIRAMEPKQFYSTGVVMPKDANAKRNHTNW
jgi:hypothetical protein